ncbi:MAG: VWA domain-containing protein [Leptospirales bacterium]|nr:VWA domain-containing protein [Leptospirales bacterium]
MKKILLYITSILLLTGELSAGPFININSVDAKKDFQKVRINFSVVGIDNNAISGLNEENILVLEDGYRVNYVNIKNLPASTDPVHLVLAIDSSKSIGKDYLEKIKKNAQQIVGAAGEDDNIAVLRFNDEVKLINTFSSNREVIKNSIMSIERHGSKTLMLDGIYDSIKLLSNIKSSRKGVLVFTDGKDEGSALSSDDIIKAAKEFGVPIYFITTPDSKYLNHANRIAKLTDGVCISLNKNVADIYGIILSRIKNIYEIYYQSIVKADNSKHTLEVRLRYGDIKDSDTAEFIAARSFFRIDFHKDLHLIFLALLILLCVLFFFLLILFIKRGSKSSSKSFIKKSDKSTFDHEIYSRSGKNTFDHEIYSRGVSIENLQRGERFDENAPVEIPDIIYSQVWLHPKGSHDVCEKFPLIKNEITIGSTGENAIQIIDNCVSNKHSRIRRINGGYYLYDLISDIGTYLNGKKILRPKLLHDWDEITIGKTTLIFRAIK